MSSRCRPVRLAAAALLALAAPALADEGATDHVTELRVCADPNNLPFSNDRGEGFENRIVALLAADLGIPVRTTWWAQRRGFVRNTLKAGLCDVIPGVPVGYELTAFTRPYYRSSYVFVSRADAPPVTSFDDPRLRAVKVGVQMIGNDATNTPPAHALSRRGIVLNVSGYTVYGDYAEANPPASSARWRRARWRWPSRGVRSPATSPRRSRCHCRSPRSARSTNTRSPWSSTSAWACGVARTS
ncbi:MAG TPA: hypothetical protein VD860_02280 [Azospirillum sp.]|nr:hypothetical protein [Azospirillum sp.]